MIPIGNPHGRRRSAGMPKTSQRLAFSLDQVPRVSRENARVRFDRGGGPPTFQFGKAAHSPSPSP
eukprot:440712-Pyramimonas_sp.AAC.1